ncbi:MAG TPA: pilin [Candidatus Saccharimonadales bacterium]|nr:pilin [Candidatus Saccharimonadales bacterium]
MNGLLAMIPALMADTSSAGNLMHAYITPIVQGMAVLASLVCVFFLINGGFHYMTSSGKPENLEHAKKVIRNALIGLVIVLAASALTAILSQAYTHGAAPMSNPLPTLNAIKPVPVSNGLVAVLIKAITGLLNNIVQSIAAPFIKALSFFTSGTPLISANSSVFNLWLAVVGMTDAIFVLVVALLGFHVMSYATFGLDEIEFKHLLPQLALIFLLINSSAFLIDGLISFSNAMIHALEAGFSPTSVWDVLTKVTQQAGGFGVAALLIMIAFLIFAIILLIYYVTRIVTLYIGAVLAPLVLLVWLIPGFRDFSESAAKTYLATIFVLFVHVVILELAASLFLGLSDGNVHAPDPLMAMVVGIATLFALLKTQGFMMQLSYVSTGPRTARKLGGQFMTGVSYLGSKGKAVSSSVSSRSQSADKQTSSNSSSNKSKPMTGATYTAPSNKAAAGSNVEATTKSRTNTAPTGTTTEAKQPNKTEES